LPLLLAASPAPEPTGTGLRWEFGVFG